MPLLSPGRLLHLVFADSNDIYFCNEILALNYYQYLWLKLHEQGFGCVYFLEKQDDEAVPDVLTYGDNSAKPFRIKSGIFAGKKNAKKTLCEWITKRLSESGKELSAIVCSMEDFCTLFSDLDSKEFLQGLSSLKKRSGSIILTASPEAEESKPLLLNSMAFEYLGEPGIISVRKAGPCDMYGFLKDALGEGMTYLNTFTKERLHCLVTRLLLEAPQRRDSFHLQKHMEDYLFQWMNNDEFRYAEHQQGARFLSPYISYLELYNQINEKATWLYLSARAKRIAQCGDIKEYAKTISCYCVEEDQNSLGVRRKAGTYADKCMRLSLNGSNDIIDAEYHKAKKLLTEVKQEVCAPKNRADNPIICREIDAFCNQLREVESQYTNDYGTLRRCLEAMRFCIKWCYADVDSFEQDSVLVMSELLNSYITLSMRYFVRQRDIARFQVDQNVKRNPLAAKSLQQLICDFDVSQRMLKSCEQTLEAKIVNFTMLSSSSIATISRQINDAMESLDNSSNFESETLLRKESLRDDKNPDFEKEEQLTLNSNDFDITPPSYHRKG